jgi:non-specific serine/threonine protein kinase
VCSERSLPLKKGSKPGASIISPEKFTTFGELLRFLRRKADLTQRELSIAVGYSESQISRLEQNERIPEEATLAARFVPALYIEDEPQWAARLLQLGAMTRSLVSDYGVLQPIAEAKPTPHNLPIQLTSFIGREKEVIEIKRFLSASEGSIRLLTVTGAGGFGKTRLALRAASGLFDVFPDGIWLIELAPLTEPALVPQAVATVLGFKEEPGRSHLSTLTDRLRGKTILLVLDNCEHLIQASAQLADALLHSCPNVHILATSREALSILGEKTFPIASLSSPDPLHSLPVEALTEYEAVRLFVDRAVAALPGFTVTKDNAPAVAQVCSQLDGIPLAIELAAARVKLLQVEQIAERLDDRFRLLTSSTRITLPRHQTLHAAIDWSYDLLTEPERMLLRRLSVFVGGWKLEAAEAVCAGDGIESTEILDLLTQLVNKSLVVAERPLGGEVRYRLLETIRQYVLEKLTASTEADTVRRHHAAYYLALADATRSSDLEQFVRLERIATEHDNLRAALAWSKSVTSGAELGLHLALGLVWFWIAEGYWSEGRNWLESALAHVNAEEVDDPRAQAQALSSLGNLLAYQGDYTAAQSQFSQSLQLSRELGDRLRVAWTIERLGWLAREQGDIATARVRLEEALALARDLKENALTCGVTNTLAEAMIMQGDIALAKDLLEENLAWARKVDEREGIPWAMNHLGHIAQIQGDYERAMQLHEESLLLFRTEGRKWMGVVEALHCLGETALSQGDAVLAGTHLVESLVLSQDLGERACIAWCLAGLAGVAALNEEPERAAWLWGAAEKLRQSIGAREAPATRATHERLKADVRAQLGDTVFNAKWAEGQSASVEAAIAEATR